MRTTVNKAIAAGAGALLTSVGTSCLDGQLTAAEGIVGVGLACLAAAATWYVPYQRAVDAGDQVEPTHRADV